MLPFNDVLKRKITEKFMSVSVNHSPQENPDFVDETLEVSVQAKEDIGPIKENLEKPTFLKGDELTREFSFDRDIKTPHVLYLCIYKVNRVLYQPFLEFYMTKGVPEYTFPHKELSPELFEQFIEEETPEDKLEPIPEEIEGGGEPEDIEQAFLDQISTFFEESTGSPLAPENYKGFLEIDNNIFAIIETHQEFSDSKENLTPVIVDEIKNKRTIALSPLVLDLFTNNKILTQMGQDIPIPQVLYLCEKDGDIYKNVYYEQQEVPHYTIINEQVLHPEFKKIYLFSETPLPSENPIDSLKRYAVFKDKMTRLDGEPDYWYTRSLLSFVEI